jgi:TonB family protein
MHRRKILFFLLFFFQSFISFSQSLEYLNHLRYPVLDTSKYDYEYLRIVTEKNGVIHTQIFNLDTVKVYHATALIDKDRNKISERILSYYSNSEMEYNKRINFQKEESEEKYYYPSGVLKSETSNHSGELISEIYYAENGEKILKPLIEDASPKGGIKGWNSYLAGSLRYPPEARAVGAEGMVILSIDLSEIGEIQNVHVANAEFIHEALWKEAVRVVMAYPHKWVSQKENGNPVSTTIKLPIRFKLS